MDISILGTFGFKIGHAHSIMEVRSNFEKGGKKFMWRRDFRPLNIKALKRQPKKHSPMCCERVIAHDAI